MVTKRTILLIQGHVQSAVDRLKPFADRNEQLSPYVLQGILERDLADALEHINYAMEVAE